MPISLSKRFPQPFLRISVRLFFAQRSRKEWNKKALGLSAREGEREKKYFFVRKTSIGKEINIIGPSLYLDLLRDTAEWRKKGRRKILSHNTLESYHIF